MLFPNEFILLVSKPGIGKTVSIDLIENLLRQVDDGINILPTTSTKEQIYNEFQGKAIRKVNGADFETMCSAVALPDELGIFIRSKDFDFMQDLIKFYDCKKLFTYKIKHGEGNRLENISLTIIGGTQPDTLRKILPSEAFGMGFAARLVLVYSDERIRHSVFGRAELDKAQEALLAADLRTIYKLSGKYVFTSDAERLLETWYSGGCQPVPSDRRLASYVERRLLHTFKLSIIFAAAAGDNLIIEAEHVQSAIDFLIQTEEDMPKAFSAMGENSSINQIENVYSFLCGEAPKHKGGGVPEHLVRDVLIREMPIYSVKQTLQEMQFSGWIELSTGEEGQRLIFAKRKVQTTSGDKGGT